MNNRQQDTIEDSHLVILEDIEGAAAGLIVASGYADMLLRGGFGPSEAEQRATMTALVNFTAFAGRSIMVNVAKLQ
ncbi:hypothetical protein GYD59_001050 [Salmonella enterica]|nr:hypothetical protein [Salmonella enterica]EEH2566386.1 hypothetical protein [Salmonella enterica]